MKETMAYLVPDYYPAFACKMGACRSACCEGWPISFSLTDYFKLLSVECSPELRRKIEALGFEANSAFPFNLEIMAPGAGKGMATRWLTEHMGLNREQVMGFGDYTNDLSMLACVGWPVAVDNAIDEVKRACRIIAPSCEDDGVAQTIQKYVLGDESV